MTGRKRSIFVAPEAAQELEFRCVVLAYPRAGATRQNLEGRGCAVREDDSFDSVKAQILGAPLTVGSSEKIKACSRYETPGAAKNTKDSRACVEELVGLPSRNLELMRHMSVGWGKTDRRQSEASYHQHVA